MKLGHYAKKRESRVIKHLYKKPYQTRDDIQTALFQRKNTINVNDVLPDLIKMKLVKTTRFTPYSDKNDTNLKSQHFYILTKKGRKKAKKLIKK